MIKLHTNYGDITLELDSEKAPITVQNFIDYVNNGHYDNTIFHRVIDGFMIQGGGFEPGLVQKQARAPIRNEAANGLKNDKYTVAMARTSAPNSQGSQFFIVVKDSPFLAGGNYTIFGRVTEGMDVVDAIANTPTRTGRSGENSSPTEPVTLEKVTISES